MGHHHHHHHKHHRHGSRHRHSSSDSDSKEEVKADFNTFGYTDESNPFNDSNLSKAFVWKKKISEAKAQGKDIKSEYSKKGIELHREKLRNELERVRQRRIESERERAQWEKEKEQLEREANMLEGREFEKMEDKFNATQVLSRSKVKCEQGRARSIDLLFMNLQHDPNAEFCMEEPREVLLKMTPKELSAAREEAEIMQRNDTENAEFWSAFTEVCDDIAAHSAKGNDEKEQKSIVDKGIDQLLKNKTVKDLDQLSKDIKAKLSSKGEVIDVAYWEKLPPKIKIARAQAVLREKYIELMNEYLHKMESESTNDEIQLKRVENERGHEKQQSFIEVESESESENEEERIREKEKSADSLKRKREERKGDEEEKKRKTELSRTRCHSPPLLRFEDLSETDKALVIDEKDDWEELQQQRKLVLEKGTKIFKGKVDSIDDVLYSKEEELPLEEGEEMFSNEIALSSLPALTKDKTRKDDVLTKEKQVAMLNDKYKPRKPRYFNRVQTGYEWNKFNKAHYDGDNPPPKIVRGYKFNIFYPDLIDKTQTPQYFLSPDPEGGEDFCIIRFHAGPPYEDIAFRIVNRKWNRHKRCLSFKHVFEKGVLHLWFTFERNFYRR